MGTEGRLDEVVFLRGVVVCVAEPSMPGRRYLFSGREPAPIVRVLHKTSSVLVLVGEVLIVAISELVLSDHRHQFISETTLFMRVTHRLSSQDSAHQTFLTVDLIELRSKHSMNSPRPHFNYYYKDEQTFQYHLLAQPEARNHRVKTHKFQISFC